jgi:membrane-bound metal-dependent hydrolase YbcI (DUF457 family)
MANGKAHQAIAALTMGGVLLAQETNGENPTPKVVAGTALAATLTNLPDKLEPAIHPHHRQFFHSITCAAGIGFLGWKLLDWKPEDGWEKIMRFGLLVGCGAYLTHLAVDSFTSRSLPLLGKI